MVHRPVGLIIFPIQHKYNQTRAGRFGSEKSQAADLQRLSGVVDSICLPAQAVEDGIHWKTDAHAQIIIIQIGKNANFRCEILADRKYANQTFRLEDSATTRLNNQAVLSIIFNSYT